MQKTYGNKKGEQVFYASQNKGAIKGTHKKNASAHDKHGRVKMNYVNKKRKKAKKQKKR
jgi:hypothetical protein